MGLPMQKFTTRQYMVNNDFEFFHYKDEPTLEIDYHNHDFYEIYFSISDKVNYIIEGKAYNLKPGDILLISNKELHRSIPDPGNLYERVVIWVNPDFAKRYSTEGTNLAQCFDSTSIKKNNLLRPNPNMLSQLRNILTRLGSACTDKVYGSDILRSIYLVELLTYLNIAYFDVYRENVQEDIVYNQKVNDMIHYINDHLGEDLSLEALSRKFFTSKYHLLREFKKYTGCTPHNYALRKRLIYAREQLKAGNKISDICQSCGFGDYSNFSRSFQKIYRITPKQFRETIQQ